MYHGLAHRFARLLRFWKPQRPKIGIELMRNNFDDLHTSGLSRHKPVLLVVVASASLHIGCHSATSRTGDPSTKVAPHSSPGASPSVQPSQFRPDLPQLRGRVNDYADLLSPPEEAELAQLYAVLERETGCQMALLTIQVLPDVSIEEYSLAVANGWALGRRGIDDGLLITLARDNKSVRIEVGYGLERVISDELAKEVIDRMTPQFRAGRFFGGLKEGSTEIVRLIHANVELIGKRKR
jgi:hypothetical protein